MTILLACVEAETAVVAADTELAVTTAEGTTIRQCAKLFALGGSVVLAGRGSPICLDAFVAMFSMFEGVDEIEKSFAAALARTPKDWPAALGPFPSDFELLMVGWSRARSAMRMMYGRREDGADFETEIRSTGSLVAPWPSEFGAMPFLGTVDALRDAAVRQCRWIKSADPSAAGGGRLIVAELERSRVTVEPHFLPA